MNRKFHEAAENKSKNKEIVDSILLGESNKESVVLPQNSCIEKSAQDEKILDNIPFGKFKYAISTKNSAIMTE